MEGPTQGGRRGKWEGSQSVGEKRVLSLLVHDDWSRPISTGFDKKTPT